MRTLSWWLVLLLSLALAVPALADEDDDRADDAEVEEEEEASGAWAEYRETVGNRYLMGVTSLATFLGDPPMEAAFPQKDWEELPLAVVTKHVVGFGQGTFLSAYRAGMGTLDILFAPVTPMKMLSPMPRWNLFEIEHDEY